MTSVQCHKEVEEILLENSDKSRPCEAGLLYISGNMSADFGKPYHATQGVKLEIHHTTFYVMLSTNKLETYVLYIVFVHCGI
jgi:hypothetical protein